MTQTPEPIEMAEPKRRPIGTLPALSDVFRAYARKVAAQSDARIAALEEELAHVYWHNSYLWSQADEEPHRDTFLAHLFKVRLPTHHIDSALSQTRLMELEPHWPGDADACCPIDGKDRP